MCCLQLQKALHTCIQRAFGAADPAGCCVPLSHVGARPLASCSIAARVGQRFVGGNCGRLSGFVGWFWCSYVFPQAVSLLKE